MTHCELIEKMRKREEQRFLAESNRPNPDNEILWYFRGKIGILVELQNILEGRVEYNGD